MRFLSVASGLGRQGEDGTGSLADGTLHLDRSPVRQGDGARDCQPQAGAAHFSSTGRVDAIEPLENVRQVFGRDANAGVGDDDAHLGINARGLDRDGSPWPG